jgi:hypothetical protein
MDWATFWATFSQTHLVTLAAAAARRQQNCVLPRLASQLLRKKNRTHGGNSFRRENAILFRIL